MINEPYRLSIGELGSKDNDVAFDERERLSSSWITFSCPLMQGLGNKLDHEIHNDDVDNADIIADFLITQVMIKIWRGFQPCHCEPRDSAIEPYHD